MKPQNYLVIAYCMWKGQKSCVKSPHNLSPQACSKLRPSEPMNCVSWSSSLSGEACSRRFNQIWWACETKYAQSLPFVGGHIMIFDNVEIARSAVRSFTKNMWWVKNRLKHPTINGKGAFYGSHTCTNVPRIPLKSSWPTERLCFYDVGWCV